VLALVELSWLRKGVDGAPVVSGQADREEVERRPPGNQLRAREPGVGTVSLLHEEPERIGSKRNVLVADQHVGGPLYRLHAKVRPLGEAGTFTERDEMSVRQASGNARSNLGGPGDEDGVIGVVLGRQ
jgi:hypothetical protein